MQRAVELREIKDEQKREREKKSEYHSKPDRSTCRQTVYFAQVYSLNILNFVHLTKFRRYYIPFLIQAYS